jgi:hypothetical protein
MYQAGRPRNVSTPIGAHSPDPSERNGAPSNSSTSRLGDHATYGPWGRYANANTCVQTQNRNAMVRPSLTVVLLFGKSDQRRPDVRPRRPPNRSLRGQRVSDHRRTTSHAAAQNGRLSRDYPTVCTRTCSRHGGRHLRSGTAARGLGRHKWCISVLHADGASRGIKARRARAAHGALVQEPRRSLSGIDTSIDPRTFASWTRRGRLRRTGLWTATIKQVVCRTILP